MAVKCFVLINSVCYSSFLIEVNYLEERAPFSNSHQGPMELWLLNLWTLALPDTWQQLAVLNALCFFRCFLAPASMIHSPPSFPPSL